MKNKNKAGQPNTAEDIHPSGKATYSELYAAKETLTAWNNFEKSGKIVDFLKHAIRMETERDNIQEKAKMNIFLWQRCQMKYLDLANKNKLLKQAANLMPELETVNLRTALKNCLRWTHRAMELEVSGSMLMAATEHAEAARQLLDSENV